MKKHLLTLLAFISTNSFATEVDSKTLIHSCKEYVAIYNRRGEKGLIAGISTSVAEAMRAGICRGTLEEHTKHEPYSCGSQWYQQAVYIAKQDPETYQGSRERLLEKACAG
ncbi:hypothetical protein ACJJIE_13290 [Microbulbifer sp. TRSA001]|uniref:hypothetical protein n=1 Tax=Microbulbifer sp. TRSA001 TaxID=3243381 RepID=UPI00403A71BE